MEKLISAPALQFKGTGWYVTDYGKKGSEGKAPANADGDATAAKKEESKADAKADAKTDAKADTKTVPKAVGS
jgi:predicted nucleic acid-binding Zn ribbon protein